ncbi:MAG: AhpC/TSA family protein [Actinomycetota bacterium]|nr:AhpC/TSA family protein [Actinomycetota bacterium]
MRDRYDEFEASGANVAAIGMGLTAMAADFREKEDIPFALLVDRHRQTHAALELKRGNLFEIAGPKQVARGIKSLLTGNSQGRPAPKQDILQLGGALVVAPGGDVLYRHQAAGSEDNAPVADLLAALP